MSELEQKLLRQELEFYTNLLKKHENMSNNPTKSLHDSQCKTKSAFNISRTVSLPSNSLTLSHQNSNKTVCLKQPTLLSNKNNKYFTDKSLLSTQNVKDIKQPSDKFVKGKCSVINQCDTSKKNSLTTAITSNLPKKSSESEDLLKEIVFLTNLLKNSSEKSVNKSNTRIDAIKKPFNVTLQSSIDGCQNNFKIAHDKNVSNYFQSNSKYNTSVKSNIIANSFIAKSTSPVSRVMITAKNNTLSKTTDGLKLEKNMKKNVFKNYKAYSVGKQNVNYLLNTASKHKVETLSTPEKERIHKKLILSPSVHEMSSSPLLRKRSVFSQIFEKNPKKVIKGQPKNKFIYSKLSPVDQKFKILNSKYKVVNKRDVKNSNKVFRKRSSENLVVNDSDSLSEFLNNSELDKLEQHLLAVSSSLTTASEPGTSRSLTDGINPSLHDRSNIKKSPKYKILASKYKIVNKNVNSKNLRFILSKTPPKKLKLSKYKIINKNVKTPKGNLKSKDKTPPRNSVKKVSKKIVLTKFSIINKHSPVIAPCPKLNSILVKRLYKSKSTLINKNSSPSSYSAKLIKSKYFGTKRKLATKQYLHPKSMVRMQKFRGLDVNYRSGPNKYKCVKYPGSKRKMHYIPNKMYFKNNVFNSKGLKVLNIHGSRYSMSFSGKKIKKLPTKGQLRINKASKRLITGKPYLRTPESIKKMPYSPSSFHVANRVLHRSINRVLTASTKKSLSKINTYCMFYNRFGRCNRGVKCTYIHDPSKIAVCTRFLRGTCKTEGCPFSHEVAPGKMAICSYFLVDACDKDNCPYRHEPLSPNAVLCKAFVQGYCPKGKECNKAHILICPKFILGECNKGSSCAYPHPPQKSKKIIPKDTVDKVVPVPEKKDDDGLLEKVARYFQSEGNSIPYTPEKNSCQVFVPRPRKLEEQPAFIPLSNSPGSSKTNDSNNKL